MASHRRRRDCKSASAPAPLAQQGAKPAHRVLALQPMGDGEHDGEAAPAPLPGQRRAGRAEESLCPPGYLALRRSGLLRIHAWIVAIASSLSRCKDSSSDFVSIRTSGRGGLGCGGFAVLFMGVETAPRWIARKMPSTPGYPVLTLSRPGDLDRRAEGTDEVIRNALCPLAHSG